MRKITGVRVTHDDGKQTLLNGRDEEGNLVAFYLPSGQAHRLMRKPGDVGESDEADMDLDDTVEILPPTGWVEGKIKPSPPALMRKAKR